MNITTGRDYNEAVADVENHTAEILDARESCTDVELFVRSIYRRRLIDDAAYQEMLTHLARIRRGVELGHRYVKRARENPI